MWEKRRMFRANKEQVRRGVVEMTQSETYNLFTTSLLRYATSVSNLISQMGTRSTQLSDRGRFASEHPPDSSTFFFSSSPPHLTPSKSIRFHLPDWLASRPLTTNHRPHHSLYNKVNCVWYDTRTETRFRLLVKRTSPLKSAESAPVQSTTGSRGVRISGGNAGYTMFRGSVKGTGYPLHSSVSLSLTLPCVTVCHHISTGLYLSVPDIRADILVSEYTSTGTRNVGRSRTWRTDQHTWTGNKSGWLIYDADDDRVSQNNQ